MTTHKNQRGFAIIEFFILVLVVAVIAIIGFKVATKESNQPSTSPTSASQTPLPTKISSKADAISAAKALDSQPVDSQLDPNQFDADLKSLL